MPLIPSPPPPARRVPAALRRCLQSGREHLGWPGWLGLLCLAGSLAVTLMGPPAGRVAVEPAGQEQHPGQGQELARLLALAQRHQVRWLRSKQLPAAPARPGRLQLTLQGRPEHLEAFMADLPAALPGTRIELLSLDRTASTARGDLDASLQLTFRQPGTAP